MSLRLRIFVFCTLLALLPALPLTLVVRDLVNRSITLGLSPELQAGLTGGAEAARIALRTERDRFRGDCAALVPLGDEIVRALIAGEMLEPQLPGNALLLDRDGDEVARRGDWSSAEIMALKDMTLESTEPLSFPRGGDRTHLFALLNPEGSPALRLLISRPLDPGFLTGFTHVVEAQQLLAGLNLERSRLQSGFILPFIGVYAVVLALSLLVAALLSRRLTRRLGLLVDGTRRVGEGDWRLSLPSSGDDEISHLITAFNAMVMRLERQRRRLTDLEKMAAWREMARGLAHEIKNPLTPIALVVQELRDRYRGEDPVYGKFLDESGRIIEEEIDSLRRLAREFSEFARMPEMNRRSVDLNALLRDLAHLYGSVAVELNLSDESVDFTFDAEHMRRAFSNLFENALAALAHNEGERSIAISTEVRDGHLQLEFADNGPGVPAEIRERVFEPHFTTKGSGMGLGLALVRSVINLHGGDIRLGDGPGARFHIELPPARPPEHEERT
ncbi:MAG: HAMP domain-containing protein [bacterium]|nr:HAMP domain-containing protein [bacterium]